LPEQIAMFAIEGFYQIHPIATFFGKMKGWNNGTIAE
jgi:hypothetical protein